MNRRRSTLRGVLAVVLAAAVGTPLLGAAAPATTLVDGPTPLERKAEAAVERRLADKDEATFWIQLDSEADTSAAKKAKSKSAKGGAVIAAKKQHADRTQAGLRALLKKEDARYEPYWISNTIRVTADRALAEKIAARDEVAAIQADDPVDLPAPLPAVEEAGVGGVEWNVDAVKAPRVWDELGVRGEGIVIGSIDTGADHDHPALLATYRGLRSDGTVDHAYNWFDPTGICGERSNDPCDDNGHGTHTLGTMLGDDGAGNRTGVAPGAQWIAAKGCGSASCDQGALMAAGQWMLAPTDARGENPRPDLAPDVINNSWGNNSLDTWYKPMVQAWRDAGIFPSFSNGNNGPGCDTAGAPGALTNSYASGAFDSTGRIASFSSRGPGESGTGKPDVAAPGVNVRSAVPGGGYVAKSGTSMAAPHTAATVALVWSAAPALRGDVTATEELLGASATDVDATGCGGTVARNNVFGEGRLDAYAAVTAAPRGALGALDGTVTSGGEPVADAEVRLTGSVKVRARTAKNGTYTLPRVTAGTYEVTVTKFGFLPGTAAVTVVADGTVTTDIPLQKAPTGTVSGIVRSASGPEADVEVLVQGTPARTVTGTDGGYSLTLPTGDYRLTFEPRNKCAEASAVAAAVVTGSQSRNVDLASRADAFGTTCRQIDAGFPTGDTKLDITGPYSGYANVTLPFPVPLYGRVYDKGMVTLDGVLAFGYPDVSGANTPLPERLGANGALYPFWDDLRMDGDSGIHTAVRGTAPHREYVVEWRNMQLSKTPERRLSFAAVISEDGTYTFHYQGLDAGGVDDELGAGATVGAENHEGNDAFLYAFKKRALRDGMAIRFLPERHAVVSGTVTDGNDGKPLPGATVTITRGTTPVTTATARADGSYLTQIPVAGEAEHTVRIAAPHYETVTRTATLQGLSALRTEAPLRTGAVTADRTEGWKLVIPPNETRERTLTLSNAGSAADYTVKEKSGATWLKATPAAGRVDAGARQAVTLAFDTTKATPGTVLRGTLVIASESGRAPTAELPLTVVVPAYRAAVDSGADGTTPYTDGQGDTWTADRAWTDGSYGYVGDAGVQRTTKSIGGTEEQPLLRTARLGVSEYRFDGVPNGVYQVELGFAELSGTKPGKRVFDVSAEGVEKVSNVDVALETGGGYRALDKTFTVKVTDGRLDLALTAVTGETLVGTVRATHRPDLTG